VARRREHSGDLGLASEIPGKNPKQHQSRALLLSLDLTTKPVAVKRDYSTAAP